MLQTPARWSTYRVPDSLADDTEERIVGTEWHQEAIGDSAGKLRAAARRRRATWGVCEQVALAGLRHADGRPYDPRPDVMVLAQPLPAGNISTVALADAGVPLFVIEVASRSTLGDDIGDKRQAYEAIGVPEYLVFDPDGALLEPPILAWRLEDDHFVPWRSDEQGVWHSVALGLGLRATQPLLTVYDHAGSEIPGMAGLHDLTEWLQARSEQLQAQAEQLQARSEQLQAQAEQLQVSLEAERRQRIALEEEVRRLHEGYPTSG